MLYTVPNKQTWNSILHNSNLGVRGPRYTRKFLERKNRVNRGKGVCRTYRLPLLWTKSCYYCHTVIAVTQNLLNQNGTPCI